MGKFSIGYSVVTLIWMVVIVVQTVFCLSSADWAAWFGAIGTIGTLTGTIWLSVRKDVEDRRSALRRAYAIAAGVQPALARLVSEAINIEFSLDCDHQDIATMDSLRTIASDVLKIRNIEISSIELGALSVLDGSDAFRLAHAIGLLADFQLFLKGEVERFSGDVAMSVDRASQLGGKIERIRKMFQAVHEHFRDLSYKHATDPSGQELSGDWP